MAIFLCSIPLHTTALTPTYIHHNTQHHNATQHNTTHNHTPHNTHTHTVHTPHTKHPAPATLCHMSDNTMTFSRIRPTSFKVARGLQRYTKTICWVRICHRTGNWSRPMHSCGALLDCLLACGVGVPGVVYVCVQGVCAGCVFTVCAWMA